jgi:hypothetical protein
MLVGLIDRAADGDRLVTLMKRLARGRADLFNLVLGHVSRSYLLWTYMGLLIKDEDKRVPLAEKSDTVENKPTDARDKALAAKDDEIAELRRELAALKMQLEGGAQVLPDSPVYSLSSSGASSTCVTPSRHS